MDLKPFAMFVRATGKGLATRFGKPHQPLGWRRDPETGEITHDIDTVWALTHGEVARYGRGYQRQIREAALEECDGEDYIEALKAQEDLAKKAAKAAENVRKKAAAQAKKNAEEVEKKAEADKAERKKKRAERRKKAEGAAVKAAEEQARAELEAGAAEDADDEDEGSDDGGSQ